MKHVERQRVYSYIQHIYSTTEQRVFSSPPSTYLKMKQTPNAPPTEPKRHKDSDAYLRSPEVELLVAMAQNSAKYAEGRG